MMMLPLILLCVSIYTLLVGYGMFHYGHSRGFKKGYHYVTLIKKAKKNESTDV